MIAETFVNGIPTLRLSACGSAADICPLMGANPVRLTLGEWDAYRTPPDLKTFQGAPNVYGQPLLFPPNRINGGRYAFDGRLYTLPVNEPARGHHIHGTLSATPFALVQTTEGPDEARADFAFQATREHPYLTFPHTFSVTRTFILNQTGLLQRVRVQNTGDTRMPVGVGFHTALNLRCLPDTDIDGLLLSMPVKREIMLDKATIIPTGERAVTPLASALTAGISPRGAALSAHFERAADAAVRLWDQKSGRGIACTASPTLAYLMLWNAGGGQDFVCPEPQSWIVDAPNQSQREDESGFRALSPGEIFEVWTKTSAASSKE